MAKMELEFIFLEDSISFLGSLWNPSLTFSFTLMRRNNAILPHRTSYDTGCSIIFFLHLSRMVSFKLKPLSTKGDQHEICPYNINAFENRLVMRIEYMIREDDAS